MTHMNRKTLIVAAAALAVIGGTSAGIASAASSGSIPHPGKPPWPIVVSYSGAPCAPADSGLHAYTPTGVVVSCNGSTWK